MGQAEITDKVRAHLALHRPMTEECHVVYFLVEMRKHGEREGYEDDLLKFYCDWALHPRKHYVSKLMRTYIEKIQAAVVAGARAKKDSAEFVEFCRLTDFRQAVKKWLEHVHLPTEVIDDPTLWAGFRKQLIGVLAHQEIAPMYLPAGLGIYFDGKSGNCVATFRTPIEGQKSYNAEA